MKKIEGIEAKVEEYLNSKGILTYRDLAKRTGAEIETLLNEKPWGRMMNPKTWSQQAKLLDYVKQYGGLDDEKRFADYKAWLLDGIQPDEYAKPENKNMEAGLENPFEISQSAKKEAEEAGERMGDKIKDARKKKEDSDKNKGKSET